MLFSEQKREEHNTFVNQHWASVTIYGKWQSRCKCMAAASARSMWIFILSHGHPSIHTCSQFKAKHLESSSASPHDRNTHGECVSPPMNSSSSSSSSSPFSESICMASSMKLTAFPSLGAEFWSLPNEASLVSFSLSWVKYCSANSSKSLGWFLNTSTVKLCNSSVSPSGISILIPVISLWMWTKPVCCEFQWFKSTQIRFSSRRVFWLAFFFKKMPKSADGCVVRPPAQQALHSGSSLFLEWKWLWIFGPNIFCCFWLGNPRMWPRNPWQPPIQRLRTSSSGAETAVSRKIQMMGKRSPGEGSFSHRSIFH